MHWLKKMPLNVNGDNNGGVVMFSEVMVPFVSDRERNGVKWKGGKVSWGPSIKDVCKFLGILDPSGPLPCPQ